MEQRNWHQQYLERLVEENNGIYEAGGASSMISKTEDKRVGRNKAEP